VAVLRSDGSEGGVVPGGGAAVGLRHRGPRVIVANWRHGAGASPFAPPPAPPLPHPLPQLPASLASGALYNPAVVGEGGFSPLHLACFTGNAAAFDALARPVLTSSWSGITIRSGRGRGGDGHGASLCDARSRSGDTCLTLAVDRGHSDIVQRCLMLHADVNAATARNETALTMALRRGQWDTARRLVTYGADVNVVSRTVATDGVVPSAVLRDPATRAFSSLLYPATPLAIAADAGQADVVAALLSAGADARVGNHFNITPCMHAAARDHVEIMLALHAAGCRLDSGAAGGMTALELAVWQGAGRAVLAILETQSRRMVATGVQWWHRRVEGRQTALHLAAATPGTTMLAALLRDLHSHDGAEHDEDEATVAVTAAGDVVVGGGDDVDVHAAAAKAGMMRAVNTPDVHGMTPLLVACAHRNVGGMALLTEHGADSGAVSRRGLTCAMLAVAGGGHRASGSSDRLDEPAAQALVGALVAMRAPLTLQLPSTGVTALSIALEAGQQALAIALLAADGTNTLRVLPLPAAGGSVARYAAAKGLREVTRWLTEHPVGS